MFSPTRVTAFRFLPWHFDDTTNTATFVYAFDSPDAESAVRFEEKYVFPEPIRPLDGSTRQAFMRTLHLLSLAAGVSYYKAAVPEQAVIESGAVTDQEVSFIRNLYAHGLGEFAFINKLTVRDRPQFSYDHKAPAAEPPIALSRKSLVAVGGGKDSCVSVELLRENHQPVLLGSVNKAKAIVEVMEAAGLERVHTLRTLSPELFRINGEGAYNGHVPITAIVSLTLVATALLTDCDEVVMSNERSASSGNREYDGVEINHQYSKSLDAEREMQELLRTSVSPSISYFSLLRPLSELDIARRFANTTRYDQTFTSCNRAFRIDDARRIDHWCGDCDKCRFVFLALAPFMSKERLVAIFGKDMLNDTTQVEGFDALIGWNAFKPFECVGEVEESIAALLALSEKSDWKNDVVVKRFVDEVAPQLILPPDVTTRPFTMSKDHEVPVRYLEMLHAFG